jgi:hypothetical protein
VTGREPPIAVPVALAPTRAEPLGLPDAGAPLFVEQAVAGVSRTSSASATPSGRTHNADLATFER